MQVVRDPSKVLYVGGFEMPDKNAAAHRVTAVGMILRDLGYEVVFLGVNRSLESYAPVNVVQPTASGFETWEVPYPRGNREWLEYSTSCGAVEYLMERYEATLKAVICYNYPAIAQLMINRLCRRKHVLHIADATEWYDGKGGSWLFSWAKQLDTNLRMRFIHVKADGVIVSSKYLDAYYRAKGCLTVELPTVVALSEGASFPWDQAGAAKRVLYAGSPFDAKRLAHKGKLKDRIDKVILLFSRLFDEGVEFHLDIFGLTAEDYLKAFPEHRQMVAKMLRRVTFHGWRSHAEVVDSIRKCDFTIFLRDVNRVTLAGFPTKLSESIACGTPVITNRTDNIEDYLIEGKTGFSIELENLSKQVEKMRWILSMASADVARMKRFCAACGLLDYGSFVGPVGDFIDRVGERG